MILTLGVVLAQIINIVTGKYYPWGWRVSLGLAGVPAIILTIGGIVLPDTPNSLVERGFEEEGRKACALLHSCSAIVWHVGHDLLSLRYWVLSSVVCFLGDGSVCCHGSCS